MRQPRPVAGIVALLLMSACSASQGARQPAETGRRILLSDSVIRFEERGPVQPVGVPWLLVHGLGGSLEDFHALMERASPSEHLVAIDLPGFGQSVHRGGEVSIAEYSAVVGEVIDALGLERPRLVCHSMGGQVCIDFVLGHPDRVRSLTLIDSAGVYARNAFLRRAAEGMTPVSVGRIDAAGNPTIALLAGNDRPLLGRMTANDAFVLSALDSFEHSYRDRLRELRVPVLVIWGTEDPLFSTDDAFVICANAPDCEVHLVQGAGHSPHESHTESVVNWIEAFHNNLAARGDRDA